MKELCIVVKYNFSELSRSQANFTSNSCEKICMTKTIRKQKHQHSWAIDVLDYSFLVFQTKYLVQYGQINIVTLTHHLKYRTTKSVTICINYIKSYFPTFSACKQDHSVNINNRVNPYVKEWWKMFCFVISLANIYYLRMHFHKKWGIYMSFIFLQSFKSLTMSILFLYFSHKWTNKKQP